MAATLPTASAALSLYRGILRAHRTRLSEELRKLGDAYVREEFRRHRKAKPEFVVGFMREWNSYLRQLEATPLTTSTVGVHLDEHTMASMNDEQRAQLQALRAEALASFKRV